jgi:hypothetical protein
MKTHLIFFILALSSGSCFAQGSYNWNDSPFNFQNSEYNYNNNSYNYNNSPYNFNNSPYNFNATNSIYDNNGNRIGYETQAPSGVTNIFDNNGNRIGYSPAKK